jgi:hypothetical protein
MASRRWTDVSEEQTVEDREMTKQKELLTRYKIPKGIWKIPQP